jgi:hypothetical protein
VTGWATSRTAVPGAANDIMDASGGRRYRWAHAAAGDRVDCTLMRSMVPGSLFFSFKSPFVLAPLEDRHPFGGPDAQMRSSTHSTRSRTSRRRCRGSSVRRCVGVGSGERMYFLGGRGQRAERKGGGGRVARREQRDNATGFGSQFGRGASGQIALQAATTNAQR